MNILRELFSPLPPEGAARFFSRPPTVETERLVLRPMRMSDARDIFSWCSDPEVARHCLWDAHKSIWDSRQYLRWILNQYRDGEPCSLGIVDKQTGRLFGTIGWMSYHEQWKLTEVGYSMARDMWGHGYMTEALTAVIRLTFTELDVHRIEAQHEADNPASGRVMQRCGLRYEGLMCGRVWNKGRFSDIAQYALLREDWERFAQR